MNCMRGNSHLRMGKKCTMLPVEEVDIAAVKYKGQDFQATRLMGFQLKLFVWLIESPIFGPLIVSTLKKMNKLTEMLEYTVIPENPMFQPEFPPQGPEPGVVNVDDDDSPVFRVNSALENLSLYDPSLHWDNFKPSRFLYWTVRDYAHAYRSKNVSPSMVAEHVISAVEDSSRRKPSMAFMISFIPEDVRKQAAASTKRFEEGNPLSILDGIFVAIKDDTDLLPHPTTGGTTWYGNVRVVKKDAVCVSRLRECGVVFIGKVNQHEMGIGTTGSNPNYGTPRNPHFVDRFTGGSSSASAAIVASGICPIAIGTDGGGSIRIPSSLCGVVGLKTTYGRTNMDGSLADGVTVAIVGPIASTVEDVILAYAAILGTSPAEKITLNPSPPSLPRLSSPENSVILSSLRIGKYTEWFNDVHSPDISTMCEDVLDNLSRTYGCQVNEIVLPELQEMRNGHIVSFGAELLAPLNPYLNDGKLSEMTLEVRTNLALCRAFSGAEYVTGQHLRRRSMYYHMEVFKKVDVIVTPTTGMTAPIIPPESLSTGLSDITQTLYLTRFMVAGNLLGLPAISVPVGHDKHGLPIGIQFIGRPWAEATILRLAHAVEELSLASRKRPSVFYDIFQGI